MNCGRGGLERKVSGGEWAQPLTHKKTGAAPITPLQSRRQCPAHASQRWQALSMEYSQVSSNNVNGNGAAPPAILYGPQVTSPPVVPQVLPRTLLRNNSIDQSAALSLDNIRQSLIRQEDTIIFSLIERAQFAANSPVYMSGAMPVPGYAADGRQFSLMEYMLWETEQTHCKVRRYTSPDEHPFFPHDLPPLVLPPMKYPEVLAPCAKDININEKIMSLYVNNLVPGITHGGDDNNYGSSACYDVLALQALSKRIHYGKFVAEAKFRARPQEYARLIRQRDTDGLMALLTDEAVEAKVVERVRRKAAIYGQDIQGDDGCLADPSVAASAGAAAFGYNFSRGGSPGAHRVSYKVEPEVVAELYRRWVMPLTKEVQIEYLLRRLEWKG